MLYSISGFVIPAKDVSEANQTIINIDNTLADHKLVDGSTRSLVGIIEIKDIEHFGTQLVKFLEEYHHVQNN